MLWRRVAAQDLQRWPPKTLVWVGFATRGLFWRAVGERGAGGAESLSHSGSNRMCLPDRMLARMQQARMAVLPWQASGHIRSVPASPLVQGEGSC